MEAANAATPVVGENTAAAEPVATMAAAAATTGTAQPQRRRRPRVAFHVTGFGVFNGVPDNPTTHLIDELPGQLRDRPRRARRFDDYHGHDRRGSHGEAGAGAATGSSVGERGNPRLPAFGGEGEGAFEVRSCQVLHVSAEIGGRQVRELHAASCLGSSRGGERPSAAAPGSAAAAADSAAVAGGGSSGSGSSAGAVGVGGAGDGAGASVSYAGSGIQGKSADEGGGPGDRCGAERLSVREETGDQAQSGDGDGDAADDDGKGTAESDPEESGDGDHEDDDDDDEDVVTVFVHCGVNGGTDKFALETQGFNEADFRVPDERGHRPSAAPIDPGLSREHCRVTTIPVADVLERLGELGWGPEHVAESKDAGRFVCNYVYYTSLGLCGASPSPSPAEEPTAAGAAAAKGGGGVQAAGGASGEGQREGGEAGVCLSVAGAGGGGGGGGSESDREAARRQPRERRHSLFIHVPPFEAVPKDTQLALLMACLSTIAAAVSSTSVPTDDHDVAHHGIALGDSSFVATAAAAAAAATTMTTAAANDAVPVPPLSLSTYEAAVLAAGPEALSPGPAESAPAPIPDEQSPPAESAARAAVQSIWDGAESAEISPQPAAAEEAAGRGGGGGSGMGAQRVVQFALAGLAENEQDGHGSSDDGSGGSGGQAGEDGDHGEEEEEDETLADATRRRLIAAGFDSLDVDAAMATTGSDNAEVNMGFLLDITPLLPRGAPTDADGLNLREYINDPDQNGGGGRSGDRGRGAATSADHKRSVSGGSRSNGGGAIRPRARPAAASPVGMGGVSPKWISDVSPVRDGTPRSGGGGGGGGLLSRLRRSHKRVPSTASAASEATNDGGDGERPSDQRALSSSSAPRQRSSFTSLSSSPVKQHQRHPHEQGEYTRRTTAHVARSQSPPPLRGIGSRPFREFGSGGCVPRVAAGWGEVAPSGPNLRLALVVRMDLGMAPGTVAAQCARAALAATRKAEGGGRADTLAVWREAGESIVVLGAEDAGSLDAVLVVSFCFSSFCER